MSHYDPMIQIAAMTTVNPGLGLMCYLGRVKIFLGIRSSVPSTEIFPVASTSQTLDSQELSDVTALVNGVGLIWSHWLIHHRVTVITCDYLCQVQCCGSQHTQY